MMSILKIVTILCYVWLASDGTPLKESGDTLEGSWGKPGGAGKGRYPRQVAFLPFIALPPVYQVHQIVLIQPDARCPVQTIPPGVGPAAGPDDDLANRFGGDDKAAEPSRCVWSIVACCSPGSRNIRYTCFELLGCPGAFWDVNPCDEKVVMAAANTALRFYERNSTETSTNSGR